MQASRSRGINRSPVQAAFYEELLQIDTKLAELALRRELVCRILKLAIDVEAVRLLTVNDFGGTFFPGKPLVVYRSELMAAPIAC